MRKLGFLFVFVFCLFFSFSVHAQKITVYERNSSNNYGINKTLPHPNVSEAKKVPLVDASDKVYDFADLLTDSEEEKIYDMINDFVEETGMDMVFVLIDENFTHQQVEDYACDFYDYNDFGINLENYSGVILVRNNSTYAGGKKYYYMATTGLARFYYDDGGRVEDILDVIYDDFVAEKYFSGFTKFVNECTKYYDRGYVAKYNNAYIDENGDIKYNYGLPVLPCLGGASLITLIVMLILVAKNRMVRKATTAGQYLDEGSINYTKKVDQFTHSHTTHYTISSSSGGGSHGGSSGFGHGGGGRSG